MPVFSPLKKNQKGRPLSKWEKVMIINMYKFARDSSPDPYNFPVDDISNSLSMSTGITDIFFS